MSTINPTLPSSSFLGNNDFTWWVGTVKNADDKDARLGRAKVNILGYHKPNESPSKLPWAMVMMPTDSAATNGVGSASSQLKPGSFVVGFFLDYPDCQQPIVIGTLLSKIKAVEERDSQSALDYPRSYDNTISGSDATNTGQSAESFAGDRSSTSVSAAAAEHSVANPSGKITTVPIADGKDGGARTMDAAINYAVKNIVNTTSHSRRIKKKKKVSLTVDIDEEEQTIPVEDTSDFPQRGIVKIGDELIGYGNKSPKKLVLAKRGTDASRAIAHTKGDKVKLILKSEYVGGDEGGTSKEGDVIGTFTDTLVDLKGTIETQLEFIKDSIYWLVNQLKSFVIGQVTGLLYKIASLAIFPFPMQGKVITDIIVEILRTITCELDESIIDLIFSPIEAAINTVVEQLMGAIDAIQCIFDAIFDSVFSIVDIITEIFTSVNGIISDIAGGVGEMDSLSSIAQLGFESVLELVFSLLGIGCPKDTRNPEDITFSSCSIASITKCGNGIEGLEFTGVKGKWNPEYSKIIGTFSESGTMVAMDDTPYNSRLVIEHGPSKSGIHVYDNGDVRVTNSSRKTEVTIKDQEIIVHGNVKMVVDGDYNLKVGRDYHLEVLGHYNLTVNRESKLTYMGEHESFYRNNARIESDNGLALVASKLGLSASGQYDLQSPIITTIGTEHNHIAAGSFSIMSTFYNRFTTGNLMEQTIGNEIKSRLGTIFGTGIGISNMFQTGTETEWWGGNHNQVGMGVWSENKLGVDSENTLGVTQFAKAAASLDLTTGAAFKSTTGLLFDNAQGLFAETSLSPFVIKAPIVSIS